MTSPLLEKIVNAVLYEGYILYPYRASSKKNARERFTFGRVYPKDYSDSQRGAEACLSQTEVLLRCQDPAPAVEVTVRFLQPMWRESGEDRWQEAFEREITAPVKFSFPAFHAVEPPAVVRRREAVEGMVAVEVVSVGASLFKITVRISNETPMTRAQCEDQDAVIMRTFASTHTILHAPGGEFISLLDPPEELKQMAADCKNTGTWPVLVGDQSKGECDTMLSSPIILYDYPQIAPESVGGFFDGTEIDEILTLRVLTMTDDEKAEMRAVDEHARALLERTETTGAESLMKMHGAMREVKAAEDFFNPTQRRDMVVVGGRELRKGSSVRIQPKKRADAFDMMLAGKAAVIEAIEEDAEGLIHLAVVMDDDPGKDLGFARQPGHRFFYSVEEVEPL